MSALAGKDGFSRPALMRGDDDFHLPGISATKPLVKTNRQVFFIVGRFVKSPSFWTLELDVAVSVREQFEAHFIFSYLKGKFRVCHDFNL
jgi:hypothetical protein